MNNDLFVELKESLLKKDYKNTLIKSSQALKNNEKELYLLEAYFISLIEILKKNIDINNILDDDIRILSQLLDKLIIKIEKHPSFSNYVPKFKKNFIFYFFYHKWKFTEAGNLADSSKSSLKFALKLAKYDEDKFKCFLGLAFENFGNQNLDNYVDYLDKGINLLKTSKEEIQNKTDLITNAFCDKSELFLTHPHYKKISLSLALENVENALNFNPNLPRANFIKSCLLEKEGKYELALDFINKALDKKETKIIHFDQKIVLLKKLGKFDDLIKLLNRLITEQEKIITDRFKEEKEIFLDEEQYLKNKKLQDNFLKTRDLSNNSFEFIISKDNTKEKISLNNYDEIERIIKKLEEISLDIQDLSENERKSFFFRKFFEYSLFKAYIFYININYSKAIQLLENLKRKSTSEFFDYYGMLINFILGLIYKNESKSIEAKNYFNKVIEFESSHNYQVFNQDINIACLYLSKKELNKKIDKELLNSFKEIIGNEGNVNMYYYKPQIFINADLDPIVNQKKNLLNELSDLNTTQLYNLFKLKGNNFAIINSFSENNVALIENLINSEEGVDLEFKTSLLWSINFSPEQIKESKSRELQKYGKNASIIIIAKTINSFLNTNGGKIIIGLNEKKNDNKNTCKGISEDIKKLKNFSDYEGEDGFRRFIQDKIVRKYFDHDINNFYDKYIKISFISYQNKRLCIINVSKSEKPVFVEPLKKEEEFWIRVDSEKRELKGKELSNYIRHHFKE